MDQTSSFSCDGIVMWAGSENGDGVAQDFFLSRLQQDAVGLVGELAVLIVHRAAPMPGLQAEVGGVGVGHGPEGDHGEVPKAHAYAAAAWPYQTDVAGAQPLKDQGVNLVKGLVAEPQGVRIGQGIHLSLIHISLRGDPGPAAAGGGPGAGGQSAMGRKLRGS